jgi:ElaB/YqjD/DUF883 family membrane-anchored ribosome-binding protein
MKVALKPGPLVALIAAVVLAVVGQYALAAIALIAWVGILAFGTMRQTATVRTEDPAEAMDPDSRALFAPIRRLTKEIEELVERNRDTSLMRTVGAEARDEAQRIRQQVAHALQVRGELKRALRGKSVAAQEADELETKASSALTEAERDALSGAAEARRLELTHYETVEQTLARIDGAVRQAEAALSEIRARLAVGTSGERAAQAEQSDDLRDTVSRLKALSLSVDEAEHMLRGR